MHRPFVECENVSKSFGGNVVLDSFNMRIEKNEVISVIGASGSGKSTLLRLLMGLDQPDSGDIFIDGKSFVDKRNREDIRSRIGMVFQSFNLFPNMTAEQNVSLALKKVKKKPSKEARDIARDYLAQVGLSDKLSAFPSSLSGGQSQRVAIARALALQPELMLFDEITSALDPELVRDVLDQLSRIADQGGTTMVIVTHEMRFARAISDRVVFFNEGKIMEDGVAEKIFDAPEHPALKQFLEKLI